MPPPVCLDPFDRKDLVESRDPLAPKYVYYLWVAVQRAEDERQVELLRTYASHSLAFHDALCQLRRQHDLAGVQSEQIELDEDYERKYEGRY